MPKYNVAKLFDNFEIGDEVSLNLRQAKYRLLSGHIVPIPAEIETPAANAEVAEVADLSHLSEAAIDFALKQPHRAPDNPDAEAEAEEEKPE